LDQFNQLQNNLRQVRQNINNLNSTLNQINQQLDNSERLTQTISSQVNQSRMSVSGTAGNTTGSYYATSPFQGTGYSQGTGYNKQFQTSQSMATGGVGSGAAYTSLNQRDEDVGSGYYNMNHSGSAGYPVSQYQGGQTPRYTSVEQPGRTSY